MLVASSGQSHALHDMLFFLRVNRNLLGSLLMSRFVLTRLVVYVLKHVKTIFFFYRSVANGKVSIKDETQLTSVFPSDRI